MSNPLLDTSGLPQFDAIRPQHAKPALEELIAAHRQKLAAILDDSAARDFASLITPLEEMGHELSRVWSPISHLQSVLDNPEWRDAYNASLPLMTEHGTDLSQNKKLQEAYQQVADAMPAAATPAMRMLVEQELRDFRLAGVALPEESKARYRERRETPRARALTRKVARKRQVKKKRITQAFRQCPCTAPRSIPSTPLPASVTGSPSPGTHTGMSPTIG